jgi:hypothetical protein
MNGRIDEKTPTPQESCAFSKKRDHGDASPARRLFISELM